MSTTQIQPGKLNTQNGCLGEQYVFITRPPFSRSFSFPDSELHPSETRYKPTGESIPQQVFPMDCNLGEAHVKVGDKCAGCSNNLTRLCPN